MRRESSFVVRELRPRVRATYKLLAVCDADYGGLQQISDTNTPFCG